MSMGRRIIQNLHTGYELQGKSSALSAPASKSLKLFDCYLHNRSGSTSDLGVVVNHAAGNLGFGTLIAASTPDFTDSLATIQAGTAVTIFTTTNNDGFLVQSSKKFGLVCLTLSQASTGSPVYAYEYYNGSSYATLTAVALPVYSSTGDVFIVFAPPRDWVAGTTAAVGGSSSLYSLRVRATTAPSQAVKATALMVGNFLHFQGAVSDGGLLKLAYPVEFPYQCDAGESISPYFKQASAANMLTATYMIGE